MTPDVFLNIEMSFPCPNPVDAKLGRFDPPISAILVLRNQSLHTLRKYRQRNPACRKEISREANRMVCVISFFP